MVEPIILPGEIIYYIVIPLTLASIPGVIAFIKRQEVSGQKSAMSELNINTMREDLAEVKSNVKESRKEMQELKDTVNIISMIKDKIEKVEFKVEGLLPRFEDALRSIELNKLRIHQLEKDAGGESK